MPVRKGPPKKKPAYIWTVAALDGTQDIVRGEMSRRLGHHCLFLRHPRNDEIHFAYRGPSAHLLSLATPQTLLLRRDFAVVRPRTLLSPEHTAALCELIDRAQRIKGIGSAVGFRFDAAGARSPTMRRLAAALESQLGLPFDPHDGDCVIALRPGEKGWEVLCRVGQRPLAARPWRKVNYPGSLNAALAACLVELTQPQRGDRYLNIMCGSGTLLIERLLRQPVQRAVGIDNDPRALNACRENAAAAGVAQRLQLVAGDACAVDFPAASFDVITADLPWGELIGSRADNVVLYKAALAEASRLCRAGGRMVLLTQDRAALNAALPALREQWDIVDRRQLVQRGNRPLCMTLRKKG